MKHETLAVYVAPMIVIGQTLWVRQISFLKAMNDTCPLIKQLIVFISVMLLLSCPVTFFFR